MKWEEYLHPFVIRQIRKGLGLTQTRFAMLCGVHEQTISKWERGKLYPSLHQAELLRAFARAANKAGPWLRQRLAERNLHNTKWWLKMLYLVLKTAFASKSELETMKRSASNCQ